MSKKKDNGLVLPSSAIEKMHRGMESDVGAILAARVQFDPGARTAWSANQVGSVMFEMLSIDPNRVGEVGSSKIQLTMSERSARKPSGLTWSVGWSEQWKPVGKRRFLFLAAGWKLSCAIRDDDPTLLLRADWSCPNLASHHQDEQHAGQPHWHVHRVLEVEYVDDQSELNTGLTESHLQEVGAEPYRIGQFVDIQRFHLAMGGWSHHADHPQRWQMRPDTELTEKLRNWCSACLVYIQHQLPNAVRTEKRRFQSLNEL